MTFDPFVIWIYEMWYIDWCLNDLDTVKKTKVHSGSAGISENLNINDVHLLRTDIMKLVAVIYAYLIASFRNGVAPHNGVASPVVLTHLK